MTAALEGGEWSAARPGRTSPQGKTRYPFYRRLDGSKLITATNYCTNVKVLSSDFARQERMNQLKAERRYRIQHLPDLLPVIAVHTDKFDAFSCVY